MDAVELKVSINQLDDDIDSLEDALGLLLGGALSDAAGKLPLLDRAKLYVLVTYAIESLLFSYIRLNGVNAKEHPVFRELTRVKQYFEKIKKVEFGGQKRENLSLNKPTAARFIKHALAGNEKYNADRIRQQSMEKAKFHLKSDQTNKKRKANETASLASSLAESSSSPDSELVNSLGENFGSASKPVPEPQNLLVEGKNSQFGSRMSTELSEVSPAAHQPLDEDQRRSESKREKRRRKSGLFQVTQD
ncbi:MAG: hypothetical protein Q9187_003032 [Circinaria calcarea]